MRWYCNVKNAQTQTQSQPLPRAQAHAQTRTPCTGAASEHREGNLEVCVPPTDDDDNNNNRHTQHWVRPFYINTWTHTRAHTMHPSSSVSAAPNTQSTISLHFFFKSIPLWCLVRCSDIPRRIIIYPWHTTHTVPHWPWIESHGVCSELWHRPLHRSAVIVLLHHVERSQKNQINQKIGVKSKSADCGVGAVRTSQNNILKFLCTKLSKK